MTSKREQIAAASCEHKGCKTRGRCVAAIDSEHRRCLARADRVADALLPLTPAMIKAWADWMKRATGATTKGEEEYATSLMAAFVAAIKGEA